MPMPKFTFLLVLCSVVSACSVNRQMTRSVERIELKNETGKTRKACRMEFTSHLNHSAQVVFEAYSNPKTLLEISGPQAILKPKRKTQIPEKWQIGSTYSFRFTMNAFMPFGKHHIMYEKVDSANLTMQSREHGLGVPTWDNYTELVPTSDSTCILREELVIQAGILNGYVTAYAIDLFEGRHKRLRLHLEKG